MKSQFLTYLTGHVGVINSNEADINRFASCKFQENDQLNKPDGFDMSTEQSKDPEIYTVKKQLVNGQTESKAHKKYIILDDVLFYISNVDEDPVVRLYAPTHLTEKVMANIHNVIHYGLIRHLMQ